MTTLLDFTVPASAAQKDTEKVRTRKHILLCPEEDSFCECEQEYWIEPAILNPKAPIPERKMAFQVFRDTIVNGEHHLEDVATVKTREEAQLIIEDWKQFCDTLAEKRKVFDGRYFYDFEIIEDQIRLSHKSWVIE